MTDVDIRPAEKWFHAAKKAIKAQTEVPPPPEGWKVHNVPPGIVHGVDHNIWLRAHCLRRGIVHWPSSAYSGLLSVLKATRIAKLKEEGKTKPYLASALCYVWVQVESEGVNAIDAAIQGKRLIRDKIKDLGKVQNMTNVRATPMKKAMVREMLK